MSWPTVLLAIGATVATNFVMQRVATGEASADVRQLEDSPNRHPSSTQARPAIPEHRRSAPLRETDEPAREAVGVNDPMLVRAAAVRRNVLRLSNVNQLFDAQERDAEWALESEVLLEDAAAELLQPLEAEDTPGRLLRMECRSTLCVIHASHPAHEQQARFASELVQRVGPALDGAFLARVDGEGGTVETHGFLARRGWVVPVPEVP